MTKGGQGFPKRAPSLFYQRSIKRPIRIEVKSVVRGKSRINEYSARTIREAQKFVEDLANDIGHGSWSHTSYFEYRIFRVYEVGNAVPMPRK